MNISELPKKKNITEFSDEDLLLWLKDYIAGNASIGATSTDHYEAVNTELARRSNERVLNVTKKLHSLTRVLVFLTIVLVVLTVVMIFKDGSEKNNILTSVKPECMIKTDDGKAGTF